VAIIPTGSEELCKDSRKGGMRLRNILLSVGVCAAALVALSGSAFAAGDAAKGKAAFAKCGICHQVGPGAKTLVGPELNGIVGRKAASVADYTMYSAGMKKLGDSGFVWTEENIDKWITDPKAMIPDSPMALAFQGIPDANERADIMAYLKTFPAQ
jgi:cytochrome c